MRRITKKAICSILELVRLEGKRSVSHAGNQPSKTIWWKPILFSPQHVTTFSLQGLKHAVLLKNFVLLEFDFIVMTEPNTDILENDILKRWPEVLETLLVDHTTHKNIIWATDMYVTKYGVRTCLKNEILDEHNIKY